MRNVKCEIWIFCFAPFPPPPEISLDPFFLRNGAGYRKILKGLFSIDKLFPHVIAPLLVSFKF